jgi:integrase/recombinase XerD
MASIVRANARAMSARDLTRLEQKSLYAVRERSEYQRYVRSYFVWVRNESRDPTDAETLRRYIQVLKLHYTGGSFSPILSAIKTGIRRGAGACYSAERAAVISEAFRDVKAPRRSTPAIKRDYLLSPSEEKTILEAMNERDRLILQFLLMTGARVSEALHIRVLTCREEGSTVYCPVMGKGGKARELRITKAMYQGIKDVFQGREFLFESSKGKPIDRYYVAHRIHDAAERSLSRRFSPHGARHTFATRMIQSTRKIQAVSEYLGHSSTAITLSMYTHESLSDSDLGLN